MVPPHPDRNAPALDAQTTSCQSQEMAMFRKSNVLATALALAAIGSAMTAVAAMPLSLVTEVSSSLIQSVRLCPPGTHPGYEGTFCWRNHENEACPPGFHLGYEGKYCW